MTDYSVLSGAVSSGLGLGAGDELSVYSGGTASGTFVSSGGVAVVYAGGSTEGATVASGGTLVVLPGGFDFGTTVDHGGRDVSTGDTVLIEGNLGVAVVPATFYGPPVSAGWVELVLANATTVNASLSGGFAFIYSGGVASAASIDSGGFAIVSAGATATNTTVNNGGTLVVLPGARVTGTTNAGGTVVSGGVLIFTENDGTYAEDSAGATIDGYLVAGGETAYVLSGGHLNNAVDASTVNVLSGGVTNGGAIFNSSNETVRSGGVESGAIISSGGSEFVLSGGTAHGTFVNSGGTQYEMGGTASGVDLSQGGFLDLPYFAYAAAGTANLNAVTDVLTLAENGDFDHLDLGGNYAGEYFHLAADGAGGTLVTVNGTPCYCRGTRILTDAGEVPVESLAIGDNLITASGAVRPIRWIGTRSYDGRFAAGNSEVLPILIKRGALADGIPKRNLYVSPLHAFFLKDVLIPARALVNGISIVQLGSVERVEYFHLELETHDVIFAEGAAAESFLDDRNRAMFQNADEYQALYPGIASVSPGYCAPRMDSGEIVTSVHAGLLLRGLPKASLARGPLTVRIAAGLNRALVPAGTGSLRLVSDVGMAAGDVRRLGALITRFAIDDTTLDLTDARLMGGFYPAETHGARLVRWTDGDALILIEPRPDASWCAIEVASTMEAAA